MEIEAATASNMSNSLNVGVTTSGSINASIANILEYRSNIFSNDPALQVKATQQFRRLLSIEKNPPIQQVIDAGVIPRFVQFLTAHDNSVSLYLLF